MNTVNFTGHVIDVAVDIVLCMALGLWMLEWSIGIEDWIGWMRIEICNVVRIWIECIDCIRESISMVFVMNRSVLEC